MRETCVFALNTDMSMASHDLEKFEKLFSSREFLDEVFCLKDKRYSYFKILKFLIFLPNRV